MPDSSSPTASNFPPPATPVKRKRGARFWLKLLMVVLLSIPILFFAGVLGYVNFGFLNNSIEKTISSKLGTPAHVGSIKTDAMNNMSIRDIAIEPSGKGEPR